MDIRFRLTILSFLQFFVWGAWLITIGTYFFGNKLGSNEQFGAIFSTLAISSLIMPAITGIIADRWMNAEKLYGILQIAYGTLLWMVPELKSADELYWLILAAMFCYMTTISLSNSISYTLIYKIFNDEIKIKHYGLLQGKSLPHLHHQISALSLDKNIKGVLLHNGFFMLDELMPFRAHNFATLQTGK